MLRPSPFIHIMLLVSLAKLIPFFMFDHLLGPATMISGILLNAKLPVFPVMPPTLGFISMVPGLNMPGLFGIGLFWLMGGIFAIFLPIPIRTRRLGMAIAY